MNIYYKFNISEDFEIMKIDSLRISIGELKNAIKKKKGIGRNCSELQIRNAESKEIYGDDETFLGEKTSVIVRRILPAGGKKKTGKTTNLQLPSEGTKPSVKTSKLCEKLQTSVPEDLLCGLCEDLMEEAVLNSCCANSFCYECIRQHLLNSENGVCPICNECNVSPENVIPSRHLRERVRRFRGSLESERKLPVSVVDGHDSKGVFDLSSMLRALLIIGQENYIDMKQESSPSTKEAEPVSELQSPISEHICCILCNDGIKDGVSVPCCGYRFCDECVRQNFLDFEHHVCPYCKERNVSPIRLVPAVHLRKTVLRFNGRLEVKRKLSLWNTSYGNSQSPQCSKGLNDETRKKRKMTEQLPKK